jgi:hypothetical protein
VEREARQLVEAAARWLTAVPDDRRYAGTSGAADPAGGSSEPDAGPERPGSPDGEQLCHGCPWCRAKAAVGPLGADTLDSVAHLLSAAAESLTLFAQSRRESTRHHGHEGPDQYPDDSHEAANQQDEHHVAPEHQTDHPDAGPPHEGDRDGQPDKESACP